MMCEKKTFLKVAAYPSNKHQVKDTLNLLMNGRLKEYLIFR